MRGGGGRGGGGGESVAPPRVKLPDLDRVRPAQQSDCTANEGPVRIQYKCMVPIYVFPEIKLLFPKQKYNVLSHSSYTEISVRDLNISRIGLPILPQEICGLILGIYKSLIDT